MASCAPSGAAPVCRFPTKQKVLRLHDKTCGGWGGGQLEARTTTKHLLTTPEGVGQSAVDPAIQLLVDGPEDAGAELDEVDDEAAHHEHEAHQQLQDEQTLQVGQQSHG